MSRRSEARLYYTVECVGQVKEKEELQVEDEYIYYDRGFRASKDKYSK